LRMMRSIPAATIFSHPRLGLPVSLRLQKATFHHDIGFVWDDL
jgi:hypothetical protein